MAFIYRIVNKINGKSYVGKTESTVEKRFKQHLRDSKKERCKSRPLYRAINKYGEDSFEVELVEETNDPEDREVFWIEYYGTYSSGYNATLGGDGSSYVDIQLIIAALEFNDFNCFRAAEILGYSAATVRNTAKRFNIDTYSKPKGENVYSAKLTDEDVVKIRDMYIPRKFGKRKIARVLNLPVHAVSHVILGHTWLHVK